MAEPTLEALRTSIGESRPGGPYETFAVYIDSCGYQATYRHYNNQWHIQNRHGRNIDPHGRVGRRVIDACRALRRDLGRSE